MDLGRLLELLVATIVFALALTVVTTHPLAATCLIQFSLLTVLEHDSKRFQSLVEDYQTELSLFKLGLLLVALVLLFV